MFEVVLGLETVEFTDLDAFKAIKTPKLHYDLLKIGNSFQIEPSEFLLEPNKPFYSPKYVLEPDIPLLFPIFHSDIDFDALAAAFYIVSRYEEYESKVQDEHGRFPANQSILDRLNCLNIPIVHAWTERLKKRLRSMFPALEFSKPRFDYIPTFDIDMAWSYKGKGLYRSLGGWAKDIAAFNKDAKAERFKVQTGISKDPFDKFAYLQKQVAEHGLEPIFFFLMGEYSDYDKNIRPDHPKFVKLIQSIAAHHEVGIHPSYYYVQNISKEISALKKAVQQEVEFSRQHYIKLKFPETYRLLIANGIQKDYSMGYPDKLGFRNGLAVPSLWYDLENEETTTLLVHPFQVMDVTLKNYLKLNPEQAIEKIKSIADTIDQYGGTMISIWHNSSFAQDWEGWQKVFEEMLSYTCVKIST